MPSFSAQSILPVRIRGELTRQRILEFIKYRSMAGLPPPTYREIGEAVGLRSSSTVYNHVHSLQKEMKVSIDFKARSIVLKRKPEEICPCCEGTGWRRPVQKQTIPFIMTD